MEVLGHGDEGATVKGTVEPGGSITNTHADYGPVGSQWCTSDGREGTPTETRQQGLAEWEVVPGEVRVPMKGLEPETEYCAELVAENEDGTSYGGQLDFKTLVRGALKTLPEELPPPVNSINEYVRPNAEGATWGPISAALSIAEAKAAEEAAAGVRAAGTTIKASAGEVSLAGMSITVQSNYTAPVKLDCKGSESCTGKLTLSAEAKGKKKRTITIGTAKFSIAAGKTATVKVKLDATARRLLTADHGRLTARLAILVSSPGLEHTQTANVHLSRKRLMGPDL